MRRGGGGAWAWRRWTSSRDGVVGGDRFPFDSPLNRVEDRVDLEGERDRRRHGAQVGWRVKEKRKRGGTKRSSSGWTYIKLSRTTAYGATQSRQSMWRDSALPRQARWHACASVAARSRRSMWRDPSGSHATGIDATKRASSWKFRFGRDIIKILN